MNRLITISLLYLFTAFIARAVMAYPDPVTVTQPDGSLLRLIMHGDETANFTTTSDGYTVTQSSNTGAWEYARLSPHGQLASTGIVARDAASRTAADTDLLLSLPRMLRPRPAVDVIQLKSPARAMQLADPVPATKPHYDYSKFRGLVILVEYEDCRFTRDDAPDIFNRMLNQRNFTGIPSATDPTAVIEYTGSVRDYYYDNSLGLFDPQFDVIGPVTVPYSKLYVNQVTHVQTLMKAALDAADPLTDFSLYDTDADGLVDMVYFIFAGAGSNYTGNNSKLIWPHASEIVNHTLDGVTFHRYACSTELYGRESSRTIDGIGTICHEFSHVLGLSDVYDVDYAENGQSVHPANWSVMASGSYLNSSKTPCAYSLYERYAIGFSSPHTITAPGEYALDYVGSTGTGYRIDSPILGEYFLLENRVRTRWDRYLPGSGMLVFRVDSTDISPWENNTVNAVASRNYYQLIRATPVTIGSTVRDSAGDPFPGTGDVTHLTLLSHDGSPAPLALTNITDTDDSQITFTVTSHSNSAGIADCATASTALSVIVSGNMIVAATTPGATVTAHDATGRTAATARADASGTARLYLPARGLYIITDGTHTAKTVL